MRSTHIVTAAAAALALTLGAGQTEAQTPKRGGTLNFAVVAEPPNYDCHASQTFALLHPISPFYSYLVRYDSGQGGKIIGDLAKSWDDLARRPHLHLQAARGRQIPRRLAADVGRRQGDLRAHRQRRRRASSRCASRSMRGRRPASRRRMRRRSCSSSKASTPRCSTIWRRPSIASSAPPSSRRIRSFPRRTSWARAPSSSSSTCSGSHLTAKRFDGYFRKGLPYLDGYKAYLRQDQRGRAGHARRPVRRRVPRPHAGRARPADDVGRQGQVGAARGAVGDRTTSSSSTPPRSRSTTRACAAPCRWPSIAGAATRHSRKITIVKAHRRLPAAGLRVRAAARRSSTRCRATGATSRSRAPRRGGCSRRRASRTSKLKLHNRTLAEPYTPVGVFLIDQWRRIGVTVEHSQVETSALFRQSGRRQVRRGALSGDGAGRRGHGAAPVATSPTRSRRSATRATPDKKLDELWDQQTRTLDPAKRKALVHEFERHLLTENYSLSIHWWQRIIVHHKKIKGWNFSPSHFQGKDLSASGSTSDRLHPARCCTAVCRALAPARRPARRVPAPTTRSARAPAPIGPRAARVPALAGLAIAGAVPVGSRPKLRTAILDT